jgi:hypothetical protein
VVKETAGAPTHVDHGKSETIELGGTNSAVAAGGALMIAKLLVEEPVEREREARADAVQEESVKLHQKLGVRPRNYRSTFDAPRNDAQQLISRALPAVTKFMNERLASSGSKVRVTEAEIAANFMSEGGALLVELDKVDEVDGYYYAGLDTLIDRYQSLKHFLPADVRALCEETKHHVTHKNEQNVDVTTLKDLSLTQTLVANAGMYAQTATFVERELRQKGIELASLPAQARVFWCTIYFNCKLETARELLRTHTVDWYKVAWNKEDDAHKYLGDAKYNATLRSANFRLLEADLDGPAKGPRDETGLPTAAVKTELVPVDQIVQQQDALFDAWKQVLDGHAPVMQDRTLDEMQALADMAVRAEGLPPDLARHLHARRTMAHALVAARYALGEAFDTRPEFRTMTFGQVGGLGLHYVVSRQLIELIHAHLDEARKLDSPALQRLAIHFPAKTG